MLKKRLTILLIFCLSSQYLIAQNLEASLQSLLDSTYKANPASVGILAHVEAPAMGLSWSGSAGHSDKSKKQTLAANQPVLIASNTKTYVAAAILKLVELGKLKLDEPIKDLISITSERILIKQGYKLEQISLRQLLSHTSGLTDYVDDAYFQYVDQHGQRHWLRDEQIALSAEKSSTIQKPGKQFAYGDINYLLLGEILEKVTNESFYIALRELLDYQKLGLDCTWLTKLEPKPDHTAELAHQYWAKLGWDSYGIDPSWDLYGGGGLTANMDNLARFFQALFDGKVIENQAVLAEIYQYVLPKDESNYCLGIRVIDFYKKYRAYYHGGFWGTDAMYLPELDASIAICTLEKTERELNAALNLRIIQLLMKQGNGR